LPIELKRIRRRWSSGPIQYDTPQDDAEIDKVPDESGGKFQIQNTAGLLKDHQRRKWKSYQWKSTTDFYQVQKKHKELELRNPDAPPPLVGSIGARSTDHLWKIKNVTMDGSC
jgi:hypothetical protein